MIRAIAVDRRLTIQRVTCAVTRRGRQSTRVPAQNPAAVSATGNPTLRVVGRAPGSDARDRQHGQESSYPAHEQRPRAHAPHLGSCARTCSVRCNAPSDSRAYPWWEVHARRPADGVRGERRVRADPVRGRTVTRRITPPWRQHRLGHRRGCRVHSTAAFLCTRTVGRGLIRLVADAAAVLGGRGNRNRRRALATATLGHRPTTIVRAPSTHERHGRLRDVGEQEEHDREALASRCSLRCSRGGGAHRIGG